MPVVPYRQQTQTAALPAARLSPDAPSQSFQPKPEINLTGVERVAQQMYTEEKQKADQIAVMDADGRLARFETDLLYNPQSGLLNRRGKDAFGIPEAADAAWQKYVSDTEAGLTTDDQRLAFRRSAMSREADVRSAVQRHVAGEMQSYDDQTTKAYVESEGQAALISYKDPERVQLSIDRQKASIADYGKRNGLNPDVIKQNQADAASKTLTGVIGRMLTAGDDLSATKYYASVKDQITGNDAAEVDKMLEEGSTRGESQRRADAILGKFTDRREALAEVKKIQDPKVRDLTEDRVNRGFDEQRAAQRDEQDQLYLRATNMVDAAPGRLAREVIPPTVWSKLDLQQRAALENRADGGSMSNDNKTWLSFLDLRPEQLGALNQSEFESQYWSKFDKQHREAAASQWAAARDAVARGKYDDPKLTNTLTFNDRVESTLRKTGLIDPTTSRGKLNAKEANLYVNFELEASKRVQDFEMNGPPGGKRHATGEEIQSILDDMSLKRVFIDKMFRDPQVPTALITEDEKGAAYVPIDSIPPAEKQAILNVARSNGRTMTERSVEKAYAQVLLGDAAAFNSIVGALPQTQAAVPTDTGMARAARNP